MAVALISANPKFLVLVKTLKLPAPYVRGLLDTMWEVCHANADPIIGTSEEVEAAAGWPGEDGVFFSALKKRKWIDPVPGSDLWAAHDYWDHCPEFVLDRLKKRRYRAAKRSESVDGLANVPGQSQDSPETIRENRCPAPAPAITLEPISPHSVVTPPEKMGSEVTDTGSGSGQNKTEREELDRFITERFPEIKPAGKKTLISKGLTLQDAYRVDSVWAKLKKATPITNPGAYLYRMLESALPGLQERG